MKVSKVIKQYGIALKHERLILISASRRPGVGNIACWKRFKGVDLATRHLYNRAIVHEALPHPLFTLMAAQPGILACQAMLAFFLLENIIGKVVSTGMYTKILVKNKRLARVSLPSLNIRFPV